MIRWVEERSEGFRLALRIRGFPTEADLYRLVDRLDGCIILRHSGVPAGMCVHREDGRGVITLPADAEGRELDHILAEEVGHYLLTRGMANLLRQMAADDQRVFHLARRWDWHDEALAREFVRAWYLPSRLVQQALEDEELASQSGCSLEIVRERRQSLARQVVEIRDMPRWSAGRCFRLVRRRAQGQCFLEVVPSRTDETGFLFAVYTGDARQVALELTADLVALTATEFALKYEAFRSESPEPVEISLAELKAGAEEERGERSCAAAARLGSEQAADDS
jgi:hypothetical protein